MKLNLWPKHYNNTQNIAEPVSYQSSPLSPYLGALELQFSLGTFYTFVYLFLIVRYQLESLHLNDYNLIYSQNNNRGLDKILTAFPLKTQHFPFTNITQNQSNQQYTSKLNPTQPQNSFTTKTKLFLSTFGVFPNIKIIKDETRVLFSYLCLFKSQLLSCLITKEQEVGRNPT